MTIRQNTVAKYRSYISNLGWGNFLLFWRHRRLQRWQTKPFSLFSPHSRIPLQCRPFSSDLAVYKQIFAQREYSCLDHLPLNAAGLILDCGANVGFSSAYFLSRFSQSTVLAVEPDPGNYAALTSNLKPFGARVHARRAAVWSRVTRLSLIKDAPGSDGKEWSRIVRETASDDGCLVDAVDIPSLIEQSGFDRVFILKMDVEGAEAAIFQSNCDGWLPLVDQIVIELHGADCNSIFQKAVAPFGFTLRRHAELTIAERPADELQCAL